MSEWELDRGSPERDAVPLADCPDPLRTLEPLAVGRNVVECRPRPRIGQQPAVHRPAENHRDALLDA